MSKVPILLVSDSPDSLVSMLDGLNIDLVRASSAQSGEFAAVIFDGKLPDAQTVESSKTPVILLIETGNIATLQDYAADYLLKPLTPQMVRAKIALYVDLFNKTQEIKRLQHEVLNQPASAAQLRM